MRNGHANIGADPRRNASCFHKRWSDTPRTAITDTGPDATTRAERVRRTAMLELYALDGTLNIADSDNHIADYLSSINSGVRVVTEFRPYLATRLATNVVPRMGLEPIQGCPH